MGNNSELMGRARGLDCSQDTEYADIARALLPTIATALEAADRKDVENNSTILDLRREVNLVTGERDEAARNAFEYERAYYRLDKKYWADLAAEASECEGLKQERDAARVELDFERHNATIALQAKIDLEAEVEQLKIASHESANELAAAENARRELSAIAAVANEKFRLRTEELLAAEEALRVEKQRAVARGKGILAAHETAIPDITPGGPVKITPSSHWNLPPVGQAGGDPRKANVPSNPACNFCDKRRREVAKMFRSKEYVICNECVALCVQTQEDEKAEVEQMAAAKAEVPAWYLDWDRLQTECGRVGLLGLNVKDIGLYAEYRRLFALYAVIESGKGDAVVPDGVLKYWANDTKFNHPATAWWEGDVLRVRSGSAEGIKATPEYLLAAIDAYGAELVGGGK